MAEANQKDQRNLGRWAELDEDKRKSIVAEVYGIKPYRDRSKGPSYYSEYVADKYGVYVEPNYLRNLVSRHRKTVWHKPARSPAAEFSKSGANWAPVDKTYVSMGLDLATRTGWSIFQGLELVSYGTVNCNKGDDNFLTYFRFFRDKIAECKPDYVFIENIYNSNNVTYRSLLLKHGLVYTACLEAFAATGLLSKSKVVWLNAGWVRGQVGIPGKKRIVLKVNACKWANKNFGTNFEYNTDSQLTDDDKADAIAVCYAGIMEVINHGVIGSPVVRKRRSRIKRKIPKALYKGRNSRKSKANVSKGGGGNSKARGGKR